MNFTYYSLVNGTLKFDHIKLLIILSNDHIKQLSLYENIGFGDFDISTVGPLDSL